MSHTEGMPSRRRLLAGATAALSAGTVIATAARSAPVASPGGTGADAEIMRLANEFWKHDAVTDDWNAERVSSEIGEAAQDEWWECLEEMAGIRATTLEGVGTKARCMLHALEDLDSGGKADDCVRAFLADLAGSAVA